MPDKIVVYWRDIPSQVIIKRGRNKGKWMLSGRFLEAIDSAAMKAGKAGTDAYVEEWRRVTTPVEGSEDIQAQAKIEADQLEIDFPDERLAVLIAAGGVDEANS